MIVLERTNARHLSRDLVPEPVDLVVCDASFISLQVVLAGGAAARRSGRLARGLIKPQFEVGKGQVGKGGVVRDPALHAQVCAEVARWLGEAQGWQVHGITPSPITGPKGNREFLLAARKPIPGLPSAPATST